MTPKQALDAKKLLEEIRDNHDKLGKCKSHDFHPKDPKGRFLARRCKCVNCGGELDSSHVVWYETGLNHGKLNAL